MVESMSLAEYRAKYLEPKPKKKRNQVEGQFQRNLGQMLNGVWAYRLNPQIVFWTYSGAGEYKPIKTAVWQNKKGLKKGDWDYRFEIADGDILRIVYMEAKSITGSLTKEQKEFRAKKEGLKNVKFGIAETMQEAEKFLLDSGIFVK